MEHPCCPQVDSEGLLSREVLQPATVWLAAASLICMQQAASQLLPEPGPRAHDSSANTDCIVRSNAVARAAALMARFMESGASMTGQVAEYCDLHHELRSDANHSSHCAKVRERMYLSRQAWSILRHPWEKLTNCSPRFHVPLASPGGKHGYTMDSIDRAPFGAELCRRLPRHGFGRRLERVQQQ